MQHILPQNRNSIIYISIDYPVESRFFSTGWSFMLKSPIPLPTFSLSVYTSWGEKFFCIILFNGLNCVKWKHCIHPVADIFAVCWSPAQFHLSFPVKAGADWNNCTCPRGTVMWTRCLHLLPILDSINISILLLSHTCIHHKLLRAATPQVCDGNVQCCMD